MTSQTPEVKEIEEVVEEIGNLLQTGEYDKAVVYLHQQLQKAREEERERIIKLIEWKGKGFHSGSEVVAWIDEQLKTLNHSELDQDVSK